MTALAVQTAAAAPPPSGPTPVAAKSDAQGGFAALLGQLNDPKAADKQAKDDAAASQTASSTGRGAQDVQTAADELSRHAGELGGIVTHFIKDVKAA